MSRVLVFPGESAPLHTVQRNGAGSGLLAMKGKSMQLYHTAGSLARALGQNLEAVAVLMVQGKIQPAAFAGSADRLVPLFALSTADDYRRGLAEAVTSDDVMVNPAPGTAVAEPASPPEYLEVVELVEPAHQAQHAPEKVRAFDDDDEGLKGDKCAMPTCRFFTRHRGNVFCGPCWRHLTTEEQEGLRSVSQDNAHLGYNAETIAEAVSIIKTRRGWR